MPISYLRMIAILFVCVGDRVEPSPELRVADHPPTGTTRKYEPTWMKSE